MRHVLTFVAAVALGSSLFGCGRSGSSAGGDSPGQSATPLIASDLVGRWQFVFTDDVRDAYRAKTATKVTDPIALEKAMKDAEAEAKASELEFTKDGMFVSRVLGEELLRDPYRSTVTARDTMVVDHGSKNGMAIVFLDHDTIAHDEPGKGRLIYERVK